MTSGRLLGGRYQVGELLGYGGMAEVHRGRDLRLGRDVAIKTLRTDLARDATFQLRFRREAQNAAALNHPAIVAVYDTGEERGQHGEALPYIVMEYVNGRTLKEVLAIEGRLAPRRAMELTIDICAALEFSHRHGIIHRDIKPGNVMLTQTGQVKVMDFGIARALASGATTMTQTSAVIGTAQYLSPEQARGEPVDARSDVYATGCVLFELVCGHPPFVGDNPVSVAYQHVREDPKPPSTSNPDVPPDVDAVVLKALAKNPLNRYQSAGEMRGDLLRAVAGRPVSAPPVLSEEQMTAMMVQQPTRAQQGYGRDSSQRGRRRTSTTIGIALALLGVLAATALAIGLFFDKNYVAVPEIDGRPEQEATALLEEKELKHSRRKTLTENCAAGTVSGQSPAAGTKISSGRTVAYDFCAGPKKVKVPRVIQMTWERASEALTENGLVPERVDVDSEKDAGSVIGVDPAEMIEVNEGTTVKVQVSTGKIAVPTVTGMSLQDARTRLQNAGFKVNEVQNPTDDLSEVGRVTGTNPDEGKPVPKGSTITIYYGKAIEPSSPSPSHSSGSPSGSPQD
jgi:serine/threonine-protein kinase